MRGIVGHGGPGSGGTGRYFFDWLTDPEKNGAGALGDFGCYNALWSLWYMGRPESVYAEVIHLRPETFPKVEDSSTLVLHYKNAINIFEGSWDLPRSFQDLEVFGRTGSLYMTQQKVELRTAKETTEEAPAEEPQAEAALEAVEGGEVVLPALVQTGDPFEGLFSGLLVGGLLVMAVAGSVVGGLLQGYLPDYGRFLGDGKIFYFFLGGAVLLAAIALVAGWFIGKAFAPRRR